MSLFPAHAASIWSVLLVLFGLPQQRLPQPPARNADDEPCPRDTNADFAAAGDGQQAALLATLTAEIAEMRLVLKDDELDTESLRERLNAALAQSLVLRASQEILEKRIVRLREDLTSFPPAAESEAPPRS